jgi:hypothetical protein
MIGVISLAADSAQKPLDVGTLVTLEIAADGKVGQVTDGWAITPAPAADWFTSGSFLLSAGSLKVLSTDGALTKFSIEGLVKTPGELKAGPLKLQHQGDGIEVEVGETTVSKEIVKPVAQTQSPQPPAWLLPPAVLGGWNVWLISALAVLLLVAIGFGVRELLRRLALRSQANWNLRDLALRDLQGLEKYTRANTLELEQWKKFSFELARILRRYSDENFHMDSADMTDREFLAELRFHQKAKGHVDLLAHILSTITEVRYGTKTLEPEMMPTLLREGKTYVDGTYLPKEEKKK